MRGVDLQRGEDLFHCLRPSADAEQRQGVVVPRVDVDRIAFDGGLQVPESIVAIALGLEERRKVVMVRGVRRVLVQLSLQEVRGLLLLPRLAPRHPTRLTGSAAAKRSIYDLVTPQPARDEAQRATTMNLRKLLYS